MTEKGDVPVTLEMTATAGTSSRRSSMGWASSLNSGEKIVPHFLRASTGSCHDVCKYGRNHTFETKSRQPIPKNLMRRSLDGGCSVDSVVLPERKKIGGSLADSMVIPERKITTTTQMSKHVTRKSLDGGSSVDSMVLLERKKTSSTRMLKNVARKSLDGGSLVDSLVLPEKEKTTSTRMPKNVARKLLNGGSSVDSVILPERKKTTWTRAKAEFSTTSRISEADLTTFIRPKLSVESSGFSSSVQREVLNERKKKLLPSPMPREVLNERKKKLLPSTMPREVLNERKKKLLAEPRTLPKSRSHTANALKNLKPETSSATRNPEAKERKLPEKSDKISKLKSVKVKPLRSALSPDNLRRKNDSKMGKSFGTSKVAAKKVVAASTGSLSSSSIYGTTNLPARKGVNLKGIPLKTHNKIKISEREQVQKEEVEGETFQSEEVQGETFRSEEVQEKTLYVIKIENEEIPHQSDQNETDDDMEPPPSSPPKSLSPPTSPYISANVEDQDVSEYTESEAEDGSYSESGEIGSMEVDNISNEGGKKGTSQNLGMLQTKEMDSQSTKLSFRRGKIIDIRSESNSPRRLKFRRGRLLGESQRAADGLRKNFKRGKEVESDTATTQETVVLRHQDVQGKKDAQGLFNNVIEETASKLVETRKSKVKALVGAFETVISLQDGKPSVES